MYRMNIRPLTLAFKVSYWRNKLSGLVDWEFGSPFNSNTYSYSVRLEILTTHPGRCKFYLLQQWSLAFERSGRWPVPVASIIASPGPSARMISIANAKKEAEPNLML